MRQTTATKVKDKIYYGFVNQTKWIEKKINTICCMTTFDITERQESNKKMKLISFKQTIRMDIL
jgi:hypothetical protein